jgi:hypothetical protein
MNSTAREIIAIAIIAIALVFIISATSDIVRQQDETRIVIQIWIAIMLAATSVGMMVHKLKK